ncbi:hypothetical protein SEA_ATUIN_288 [Arthrobacter phage Atuin]|nr:hypothetical protein SEA_ATUIN_87 [Arthrobacter phage Atuin]
MARKEAPVSDDWTAQVGRIVGMWIPDRKGGTKKAVGEIVKVTPKLFSVIVKDTDDKFRFQRKREFATSDGMRMEFGHGSRTIPARVYRDPLPED